MTTSEKSRFTRRRLAGIIGFTLIFTLLFCGAERLFYDDTAYSTTWNRIKIQQDVPDILILGNSHAYCSFVPDLINGALGVDSAVLAVTGQDALGVTDSFETVLQTGAPKLAIVELNAIYFEPGAMAQDNKAAALSNINGMPGLVRRVQVTEREFGLENIPQGSFQLLRSDLMWSRWEKLLEPPIVNRYEWPDVNGYARLDYFATGEYRSADIPVTKAAPDADADGILAPESEAELRRLLTLAQDNGVEVWLVKSPIASREVVHPNGVDAAGRIAAEFGDTVTFCYDYNDDLPEMNFTSADFYDGGHLNRRGAARFTQRFIQTMEDRLGLEANLNAAFAHLDESITPLKDGGYRYTINVSGERNLYRYEVITPEGVVTQERGWSEDATFDVDVHPTMADWVQVTICPAALIDEVEKYGMTLRFMIHNTYVLNN